MPTRILIVDDSPTTAGLIQMYLDTLGYEIAGVFVNAEDALQVIERQPPDLVLMDINLGDGISGIEAADIIMNRHRVPVIYVTSYSDQQTLEAAKLSMPFGFINKPFRDMDLKVNIEIALARFGSGRPVRNITPGSSVNELKNSRLEYTILSEALDHLVSGVIMIDDQLQIFYRNRAAAKMVGDNLPLNIRDQHLVCASSRIRRDLIKSVGDRASTIFTLNHRSNSLHFLLFPLTAPLICGVEHVQGSILFLFDTANDSQRIEDLVRTLYKLSPTEARIASRLVFNPYLADVSAKLGISYQTARTHLKRIYLKTETNKLPALIQKIVTGPAGLLIHSMD